MATKNGTPGNDFLTGTTGADTIYGHGGIDEIRGDKGADLLLGGDGNDDIDGGDGNDVIDGGAGDDNLGGGANFSGTNFRDSINGGAGNDVISADGDDTVDGGEGHDFFFRTYGDNRVYGGAGNDTYEGGAGRDLVYGGGGNDVFFLANFDNSGLPTISGGAGSDLYILSDQGFRERVHVITDFDPGVGGDRLDLDDLLINSGERYGYEGGNPFNSSIRIFRLVQAGADTLLQWNVDQPTLVGGDAWITVFNLKNLSASTLTADNIVGGIQPDGSPVPGDVRTGTAGADTLEGGFFNDTLSGSDGGDALDGRGGNDSIVGGSGNDTIAGGAGNDRLYGDNGDDLFIVDSTGTASQATGGAGVDTYRLEIGYLKLNRGYTVTDFTAGAGGDLIDAYPLLVHSTFPYGFPLALAYTGGNPFDPDLGFLRFVQSGGNVKLQWDSDGANDARATWQTVLTLRNHEVSDITVDNMVTWIPPDGSITDGQTLAGTAGDDQILGSIFDDNISSAEGADRLRGNAGDDVVDGGAGNDSVAGGLGNDTVYGGEGDDWFHYPNGEEGYGNDKLYGEDGNDEFYDAFGNNRFYGGEGGDSFNLADHGIFFTGADTITGGGGVDLIAVLTASTSRKDAVTDFEAGAGGDQISFGGAFFIPGPDAFAKGFVRLLQSGAHTLFQWDRDGRAGSQFDPVTILTLRKVTASAITSDNFTGELVVGTTGNDELLGGLGNDTVQGLAGNDTLDGSTGRDTLEGGFGSDLYFVDNADDETIEESNDLPGGLAIGGGGSGLAGPDYIDTVKAAVDFALANFVENLTLTGSARNATGNALANVIKGNTRANTLTGGDGNDRLDGSRGNDTLDGGGHNDRLTGGAGNDVLVWGTGDRFDGGTGTDTLKITTGNVDLPGDLIKNVEIVDLRGGESSTLTLTRADVLAISPTDVLRVLGDAGDAIDTSGFAASGAPVNGFRTYRSGAATLLVETDVGVI